MSNNQNIILPIDKNDLFTYEGHVIQRENQTPDGLKSSMAILNIHERDIRSKESRHLYKTIQNESKYFDRHFDNTVVDSFAFDKVIQSKEITNIIFYYLNQPNYDISDVKETITAIIIDRVKTLYQHNQHTLFKPNVYYNYMDILLDKIAIKEMGYQTFD